jgi:hypothetical protein
MTVCGKSAEMNNPGARLGWEGVHRAMRLAPFYFPNVFRK